MPAKKDDKKKSSSKKPSLPPVTYQIHAHAIDGKGLPAVDRGGTSDPYILLQLAGGSQKVISRHIENNLNPVWDEPLKPLDGYLVGNDVLKIQVVDKDKVQGSPDDDVMGVYELALRDLPLGTTTEREFALLKTDKKGKVEKKAKPGSGGIVRLRFSVAWVGQAAFSNAPWGWPFYTALIEFVKARDCPVADLRTSDPYLVAKLLPGPNDQKTKTKVIKSNLNPVWQEQKTFILGSYPEDVLQVTMWDKDDTGDDDKMSTLDIPFRDFRADTTEWQDHEYIMKPAGKFKKGGILSVKVKLSCTNAGGVPQERGLLRIPEPAASAPVPTPAPPPVVERSVTVVEEETFICQYKWGSYSSTYSTSFSGYTNYGKEISGLRASEDEIHTHPVPTPSAKPAKPVKTGPLHLNGVVVSARDLPKADSDGTDSFVVVNIASRASREKKKKQSEVIHDTSNPDYNYPFDLGEVKKGEFIEITIFQNHKILKNQPIGYAKREIKDIEIDNPNPVEIPLGEPEKFKKLPWKFTGWGSVQVVFHLTVKA